MSVEADGLDQIPLELEVQAAVNHRCGCRELNSGPLEGQRVLLTLESFLRRPGRKVFMGLDVTTPTPWRKCRNLSSPLTRPSSLLMKSRKQCLA